MEKIEESKEKSKEKSKDDTHLKIIARKVFCSKLRHSHNQGRSVIPKLRNNPISLVNTPFYNCASRCVRFFCVVRIKSVAIVMSIAGVG